MVTVMLFAFVQTWNNYLLPLLMLSESKWYPLTVGLNQIGYAAIVGLADRDPADDPGVRAAAAVLAERAGRRKQPVGQQILPCLASSPWPIGASPIQRSSIGWSAG